MLISWLIVAGIVGGTLMPEILNHVVRMGRWIERGISWLFAQVKKLSQAPKWFIKAIDAFYYELPYHTQRIYRAYRHKGKHRMREQAPDDSEVDSWPGADEDWTMILHGLNAQAGRMREEVRV